MNDTVIEWNDDWGRQRIRSLQAVDELVQNITKTLMASGQIDNTYIFFTSDNGYHLSQHRLFPGKLSGLETDIKVPMLVRGPGIEKGSAIDQITSHTDIAATILALSGQELRPELDGAPLTLTRGLHKRHLGIEHVNIEFWGNATKEGMYGGYGGPNSHGIYSNNTYKSLRLVGSGFSMYYSVWCNGEHEFYDMIVSFDASTTTSLDSKLTGFVRPILISSRTSSSTATYLMATLFRAKISRSWSIV